MEPAFFWKKENGRPINSPIYCKIFLTLGAYYGNMDSCYHCSSLTIA